MYTITSTVMCCGLFVAAGALSVIVAVGPAPVVGRFVALAIWTDRIVGPLPVLGVTLSHG